MLGKKKAHCAGVTSDNGIIYRCTSVRVHNVDGGDCVSEQRLDAAIVSLCGSSMQRASCGGAWRSLFQPFAAGTLCSGAPGVL
mmetsp:Transcript_13865/g.51765  ORF Transcript_13865/g.51765 Transcript_13865/m.51765 type:complete len:83 (-) Transcript_13865:64-312(-)